MIKSNVRAEAIGGWVHGANSLTISDRFLLLLVMICSNDAEEISKAYGLLTRQNGKTTVSKLVEKLAKNEDYFAERNEIKYQRRKQKKAELALSDSQEYYNEHREQMLKYRKKYYDKKREIILAKQRERRQREREEKSASMEQGENNR